MSEHAPEDDAPSPRLPWHHRAPVLTMALNCALILTIFLTRERWAAWYLESRLPGRNMAEDFSHISLDGRRIATIESDFPRGVAESRVVISNLETGEILATLRSEKINLVWPRFSRDGERVAAGSRSWAHYSGSIPEPDVAATVWDVASESCIRVIRPDEIVPELSRGLPRRCSILPTWSPDGKRVLATLRYGRKFTETSIAMAVLDADTGRMLKRRKTGFIYCWSLFSPDGGRLMVLPYLKKGWQSCEIWDVATLETQLTLDTPRGPKVAAWSPDGKVIVTAEWQGKLTAFDAASGRRLWVTGAHTSSVNSITFSPEGTRFATASRDMTAAAWDTRTGGLVARLTGHTSSVRQALFSPDGSRVITSSHDATVRIWDAAAGVPLGRLPRSYEPEWMSVGDSMPAPRILLLPDGRHMAIAPNEIWRRLRPEQWWGVFFLPHLYLIVALASAVAWSGWRDVKRLRRMP